MIKHPLQTLGRASRWPLLAATLWAALLSGCASLPGQTPDEIVKARASERWQLLIKGDVEKAYAMLNDGYRQITPYERYRGKITNGMWVSADVIETNCAPEKCTVRIRLVAKPPLGAHFGDNITTHFDETWLLEEGQWHFLQQL